MTESADIAASFSFDAATRALVRLAARIAGGSELDVRSGISDAAFDGVPAVWVEELILQSYLFAGFPRSLNAMRELRRSQAKSQGEVQGKGQGEVEGRGNEDFRKLGEATCRRVYGKFYAKLRDNIVELHPDLDEWMIIEGYGKVLSRPGLDLGRRELCIVAACVAGGQDRQLHSHLHGSRNVGVADDVIGAAINALEGVVPMDNLQRAMLLWQRVEGRR